MRHEETASGEVDPDAAGADPQTSEPAPGGGADSPSFRPRSSPMNQATALIIESADAELNEGDQVFLRRCEELRRAGYGPEATNLLAASPSIDLDVAIELRARHSRKD